MMALIKYYPPLELHWAIFYGLCAKAYTQKANELWEAEQPDWWVLAEMGKSAHLRFAFFCQRGLAMIAKNVLAKPQDVV